MEMYLMMLYVSLEQEEAVKDFFIKQGWAFQKPDLRVLTDHTGPLEPGIQETAERTSYEPSYAVPTFTVNPVETVIEHVTDTNTQSETVVKAKVKPKPQKRKEKSKDLGGSDKTEFQEILNEAELIAASVSQAQTVEDAEIPSTIKVKDDTEDVTLTVVQNDNEDTYDDYDDYNEQVMVEVPSTSVSGIAGDSVSQSPITETPRASKRKRREKNLDSDEWTDDGEEDEARVKRLLKSVEQSCQGQASSAVDLNLHKVPSSIERLKETDPEKTDLKFDSGENMIRAIPVDLTENEEKNIVDFLISLYNLGYGFTKVDMGVVATEYAVYLKKRTRRQRIAARGVNELIQKWPQLNIISRKCRLTLTTILSKFFDNLERIMLDKSFNVTPHLVYCVTDVEIRQDETVLGEEKILTTIIACASAAGQLIPPFFVFPGEEMTVDLMAGALPGSSGVVSEDGLVNAEVFIQFLNEHLFKNIPEEDVGKPVLIHVDAVKFCSVGLVELAKRHNVTLVFPPAEITNAVMPLDVGCIESFQAEYTNECKKQIQETETDITKANVCGIVSKVYPKALDSKNVIEGFRKTGLFPCDKHMLIVKGKE